MRRRALDAIAIGLMAASSVCAEPVAPAGVADGMPARLPAGTPVDFEIADHVNSKLNKPGDTFRIRLRAPLVVDGRTLVPTGAEGRGEVIHAARARAAGKAGELILAARYIEHGGVRIRLRGFRFGRSGQDERGTAIIVSMLISAPLGFLVVGGEIDVAPGTPGHAKVAEDIQLAATKSGAVDPVSIVNP